MRYCENCLSTDLRPQAIFTNGLCLPCQYYRAQSFDDSEIKLEILRKKIQNSKSRVRNHPSFDCIVGVSGGKDSTRQAHWVRDRLGLKPLVVCCGYPPKQMSEIGALNLSNLISMNFDVMVVTPAPKTSSELSLQSFKQFGNVCKSSEMALFATVPRLAIEFGINTILWGENPALQVGDNAVEGVDEFDGNGMRRMNTLSQGGDKWLSASIHQPYKANHYYYPSELDFEKAKINIFYLGAVWDDWSNFDNATYASLHGLTLRPNEEIDTGDLSNASMLDEEFTNINMMLKYYKYGFGRATDYVDEKIRKDQLSRDEAIKIVEKYDGRCSDQIISRYCMYVGISISEFWEIANKWVNRDLFTISLQGRPRPKFKVGVGIVC